MDYLKINELYHWGIKGQKWGVRNYRNEDGTLTAAGKARYNDDGTKKKAKDMSDEDLAKSNKRLQAEQQYEMLSESKGHKNLKTAAKIGASVVGSFLVGAGSVYAMNAISQNTLKVGKQAIGMSLAVGGLAAASALTTGLVATQGGNITRVSPDTYYKKKGN